MLILAIESSCDETAAALIDGERILANVVSTQAVHSEWGGVVPELASREHMRLIQPVVNQALRESGLQLKDLAGIAATRGPGLSGSLMVGYHFAKGLALALDCAFLGINHMEGHIFAPFVSGDLPEFPVVVLIVSGGHTQLILMEQEGQYKLLGQTLDDAAGEAFDKVAKLLGLDYPGGPAISAAAEKGDSSAINFPRALRGKAGYNFSYSGLKTAVLHHLRAADEAYRREKLADICASFEQAVVDPLVQQSLRAIAATTARTLVVAGGVAANRRLRHDLQQQAEHTDWTLVLPEKRFSTDNAVMIGRAAHGRMCRGERSPLELDTTPRFSLMELSTGGDTI